MIKTIIFDLGGVYFTEGVSAYKKFLAQEYSVSEEKLQELVEGSLASDYRLGTISATEFWNKMKNILNTEKDTKKLAEEWHSKYTPIEGTVSLIRNLENYEILFLSDNAPDRIEYLDKKYNFLNDFKDGLFSFDAKIRKPNPKIYEMILKKTKSNPEECVFIDDKEKSLPPAKALGIHTILFKSSENLIQELEKLGIKNPTN